MDRLCYSREYLWYLDELLPQKYICMMGIRQRIRNLVGKRERSVPLVADILPFEVLIQRQGSTEISVS